MLRKEQKIDNTGKNGQYAQMDSLKKDEGTMGILNIRKNPERAGTNKEQHSSNCSSVLDLMKILYKLLKNQEEYENKILAIETECYIRYVSDNGCTGGYSELDLILLRSDLEQVIQKKARIKEKLANQKDGLRRFDDTRDKFELDITIDLVNSIEKRLESVSMDRKKIYTRIRQIKEARLLASMRQYEIEFGEENSQFKSFPANNADKPSSSHCEKPISSLIWKKLDAKFTPVQCQLDKKPPEKPVCLHFEHLAATGLQRDRSSYMNSVIQCLSHSPTLSEYFNENIYLNDFLVNRHDDNATNGMVTDEFAQLIKGLWCGRYKSISPRDFKAAVLRDPAGREIDNSVQPDAREFLAFLLQRLHNDLKRGSDVCPEETSIISDLFYGQYKSTIECTTCRFIIVTYEIFQYINVPLGRILASSKTANIEEYVARIFRERVIKDWQCLRCRVPREGRKKLKINRLPSNVIICLDRLEKNGTLLGDTNTPIDFEVKGTLSFKPYMVEKPISEKDSSKNFEKHEVQLYAISNRYSIWGQAHYVSCCESREKWYLYNDEDVRVIKGDEERSTNKNAHVLFYEKKLVD